MSETIKRFPRLKLRAVQATNQPSVVLPFPQSSTQTDTAPEPILNGEVMPLVNRLCEALNAASVSYCHWKSNWRLRRWLQGHGDLDLLVATSDAIRFVSIAGELGFVQASKSSDRELPGVHHFFGWDAEAEKFAHLHVYYKLLVGHDLTTNYHLPVEKLLLESSRQEGPMPVPEPELELMIFVLRKVLANWSIETWLRFLTRRSDDSNKITAELTHLIARTNRARVYELLNESFPSISVTFFEACLNSLMPGNSCWHRTAVRLQLERTLAAHARRHATLDGLVKNWRFLKKAARDRFGSDDDGRRFENGGLLIALVGGDGSGKTTAIRGIKGWLNEHFAVRTFHFGKPRRSPITLSVIIMLRGGALLQRLAKNVLPSRVGGDSYPSSLRMFRWVCAGRDRLRVFLKARRFADSGGVAVCDRYAIPGLSLMDGPNIPRTVSGDGLSSLRQILHNSEAKNYQQITPPDLLIVLRVDPEVAVRRKTTEKEEHVRPRSEEVWQYDWSRSHAHVIDASASPEAVLAELRTKIWSHV